MLIAVDRRVVPVSRLATSQRLLVLAVTTVAALCLVPAQPAASLIDLGLFAAAASVMSLWTLQMPGCGAIRVVDALLLGSLPVVGTQATLAVAAAAALTRAARDAKTQAEPGTAITWTALQSLLAPALAATVYGGVLGSLPSSAALFAAAIVLAAAQTALSAGLKATLEGVRFYLGMIPRRQLLVYLGVLAPLGLLVSTLHAASPVALIFLLLPIAMMYRSLENYTAVLGEARATIQDMALAVERRDPQMAGHSARVAALCREMAREMALAEEDVDAITTAGRLHDLGKISVPDHVLLKADTLSDEEFDEVQSHPVVGADVVERCALVQRQGDVASLIRQHHERFDGRGYPAGLRGEEILIGARILAVAEAYDTITTPRQWRVVQTVRQALGTVQAASGSQFDPQVVNALFQVIARKEAVPANEWNQQLESSNPRAAEAGRPEARTLSADAAFGRRRSAARRAERRRLA
ncbi:MAG: HD domain-containing protein [Proteobacteria bacterium]|nr:HD domain-containing protein [Pseudomonadota bacterium]